MLKENVILFWRTQMTKDIYYMQLVRISDNKEVYTCANCYDFDTQCFYTDKILSTFEYYFDRVNSGIKQQLESPKLTDEQKKQLKLLDRKDYVIRFTKSMDLGCRFQPILNESNYKEFYEKYIN